MSEAKTSEEYQGDLGDTATQLAWMAYADAEEIPHDHEDETVFKYGYHAGRKNLESLEAQLAQAIDYCHQLQRDTRRDIPDETMLENLVKKATVSANAIEQAAAIRTAAEALVTALTDEEDNYDGLVYYEYAKELAALKAVLSRGWLAREEANPMCKCGVPVYLHGSLTACCLSKVTVEVK